MRAQSYLVQDLTGELLDRAVLEAQGFSDRDPKIYPFHRDWALTGALIDYARISVSYDDQGGRECGMWNAYVADCSVMQQSFDSAITAALRAFVAYKFGETVAL